MRPISTDHSILHHPLNELFGAEAHIRLLRVLATEVTGPISRADAADRSGLTDAGARKALGRLARTGFVVRVGGGRSQQFALREGDPLLIEVGRLFHAEHDRYSDLLGGLRSALEGLPEIRVAWIERFPAKHGEPLGVALTGPGGSLSWLVSEVQRRYSEIEKKFDLTIEVTGYTRADSPPSEWDSAVLLAGAPDRAPGWEAKGPTTHQARDDRAARFAESISSLLNHDPSLVRRALRHLDRLLTEEQGAAEHDLREWKAILESYSLKRLQDFLVSPSSRAVRLRQSSPFFAVLTADERDRVLEFLEGEVD